MKENSVSLPQNLEKDLSHYTACHNAGKWKEAEELLSRLLEQITVSGQNTAQAKIKEATVEELCSVQGISLQNAQDIAKYYQNN